MLVPRGFASHVAQVRRDLDALAPRWIAAGWYSAEDVECVRADLRQELGTEEGLPGEGVAGYVALPQAQRIVYWTSLFRRLASEAGSAA